MNKSRLSLLLLLLVLLLAAALRLNRLDLAEFKSDEAGIAREALALVHEGRLPVVGPSSSQGPAHPPLHIYLMALPLSITQDPRWAVALVALIHTAAVAVTFLLGARFFSRRVGLMAAFLFAVNPWAIYYARKMWTQNWPLATTLFILGLLLLIVERRPWALPGVFLALAALVGTHLGGLAFVLLLALALFLFPTRVRRRPLLLGASLFLLLTLPYLYHDATHGWANLRGFLDLGGGPARIDQEAARFAAWLSSGYHYQDLAGSQHQQFLASLSVDLRWLDRVEMLLLGAGVIYLAARLLHHLRGGREGWREQAGRDWVLLSWLLIPVLLQTRHTEPVYPHYFILLYPVQHLIIALLLSDGLGWLRRRFDRRGATAGVAGLLLLLIAIGAWQIYLQQRFTHFVARHDTPQGYGPVAGPLWRTASAAGEAAAAANAEILVIAPGDNPTWDNRPAALDVLLPRDQPHRFVDGRQALVYPLGPSVYVTTPDAGPATATLRSQSDATFLREIDAPGGQPYAIFYRSNASRDDVLAGMTPLDPPRRLANGVELLAFRYDERQTDGTIPFQLAWWLDGPPPTDAEYHLFAHLVDDQGQRWGQHDLASFPTPAWQSGDLVVTRFQIETPQEMPAGPYWVNLGMYSYPDVAGVPVLDVAGNPVADFTVAGPLLLRR